MQRIPITAKGLQKLEKELKHLKEIERPDVIEAIKIARSFGDLSENAEYSAAKEKQGFIEGRIKELESKISVFEVINPLQVASSEIKFGATVLILDIDNDSQYKYQIVGADEASIEDGLLAINSPLARALIGKKEGSIFTFNAPGGERSYEVLNIKYI